MFRNHPSSGCPEQYPIALLSLLQDGELAYRHDLETHLATCAACQEWLANIEAKEKLIRRYEQEQQNFVVLELFDVIRQTRDASEVGWEPLCLGVDTTGALQPVASDQPASLKFYLRSLWYGQIGIYLAQTDFPKEVLLQRGSRYLKVASHKPIRLIATDGILISDHGGAIAKITLRMPQTLQEHSITRKCQSLAVGTASFIAHFFDAPTVTPGIEQWHWVKNSISVRDLGIYLMRLNRQASYKKIAQCFQLTPHQVAKVMLGIRSRLAAKET